MRKFKTLNILLLSICLLALTGCPNGTAQSPPTAPAISITTGDIFFDNSSTVPNITVRNTSSTSETFSPLISNATGVTVNDPNNCVNMALAPGSTCTFTLSATANATTTANNPGALTVVASANGQKANDSVLINLAAPQLMINSGNAIDLISGNGYTENVSVTLVNGFNLQNTAVNASALPSGTTLTANTCSGAIVSQSSPCSITIHSSTATAGTGTIGISGNNLTTAETQAVAVDTATFIPQSPRTHLSAMSGTFSNPVGNPIITINTISSTGSGANPLTPSQMIIMTVNPDTHNATNLCTNGQILTAGSSCKVWVRVTNGPDISSNQSPATPQTGTLTISTNLGTFTLNLSATTDLYTEGSDATRKYNGTSWESIQIGGAAGDSYYSADKTTLDVLLGAIDNGNVGYYNGTSTVGSLGSSVTGDSMAVGSFSGGSNGGNNEYIFAHKIINGLNQTLDITNGYGGSWSTVTGTVGDGGANILNGTLYTGDDNALYISTNATSSSAFSPGPGSIGGISVTVLLNGTLYITGGNSPFIKYYNGSTWVNGSVSNGDSLYGLVNWNNTLYASGYSGIYKLTGLPATFTRVSTTSQNNSYGFIAATNALYMMQSPFFFTPQAQVQVQRCAGTGATLTCTSLGNPEVGDLDNVDDDIVIAPTLTITRP